MYIFILYIKRTNKFENKVLIYIYINKNPSHVKNKYTTTSEQKNSTLVHKIQIYIGRYLFHAYIPRCVSSVVCHLSRIHHAAQYSIHTHKPISSVDS